MSEHTPTPWFHDKSYKNSALIGRVQDKNGENWDDMCVECHSAISGNQTSHHNIDAANAEFIVRACNAHDALVEACRNVSQAADDSIRIDLAKITLAILCVREALKLAEQK
jgi:hypothetical protein